MELTKEEFEKILQDKLDSLPEVLLKNLDNVVFQVEDGVSPNLLGLYHGVPYTKRKRGYSLVMPDRIVLYKKVIERGCRSERDVSKKIEKVLHHEIGHFLGLGEGQLRKLGL